MNDANNFDSTILETLKFLGNKLMVQKFILRATVKQKKQFQKQESETRANIKNLMNKIQFELDQQNQINQTKKPDEKE
jgi:hypothetical protein